MSEDLDWKAQVAKWLAGQSFNNILLLAIIIGGGYCAIKVIPAHLVEIRSGYERIEASHKEERSVIEHQRIAEREVLERQHTEQTKALLTTVEKMLNVPKVAGKTNE